MKAYINNFNLLEWPKKLAYDLNKAGLEVTIIDNNSTYLPLLDWYDCCPYKIKRLPMNAGHKSIWDQWVCRNSQERYFYTDPDLDISELPSDWVGKLNDCLDKHENQIKVGLAIKIDDLPSNGILSNWARRVQDYYWQFPLGNDLYDAPVDTTLALYNPKFNNHHDVSPAIRLGGKYAVRHLPWYLKEKETWPDDFKYYCHTCNHSSVTVAHLRSIGTKTQKDCKWLP